MECDVHAKGAMRTLSNNGRRQPWRTTLSSLVREMQMIDEMSAFSVGINMHTHSH